MLLKPQLIGCVLLIANLLSYVAHGQLQGRQFSFNFDQPNNLARFNDQRFQQMQQQMSNQFRNQMNRFQIPQQPGRIDTRRRQRFSNVQPRQVVSSANLWNPAELSLLVNYPQAIQRQKSNCILDQPESYDYLTCGSVETAYDEVVSQLGEGQLLVNYLFGHSPYSYEVIINPQTGIFQLQVLFEEDEIEIEVEVAYDSQFPRERRVRPRFIITFIKVPESLFLNGVELDRPQVTIFVKPKMFMMDTIGSEILVTTLYRDRIRIPLTLNSNVNQQAQSEASRKFGAYFRAFAATVVDNLVTQLRPLQCGPLTRITGACNNPTNPEFGMLGRGFLRQAERNGARDPDFPPDQFSPAGQNRANPRDVSNRVCAEDNQDKLINDNRVTALWIVFGQFLDHDITLNPGGRGRQARHQPISTLGDRRVPVEGTTMNFDRSKCLRQNNQDVLPFTPVTITTPLVDGSMIYGPNHQRAFLLRDLTSGKLSMSNGLLPKNKFNNFGMVIANEPRSTHSELYVAGDVRANEHEQLACMHVFWAREHNHVVDELQEIYSTWDDDSLYSVAREIVRTELQSIVYEQWLPLLLGNNFMSKIRNAQAFDPNSDPSMSAIFSGAAFRFGHSAISEKILVLNPQNQQQYVKNLRDGFFQPWDIDTVGCEPFMYGMARSHASKIDSKVPNDLRNLLFFGSNASTQGDLVSFNIQRGRDIGLPTFLNTWRLLDLGPVEDVTWREDPECQPQHLQQVYGTLEDIDLWVGILCEQPAQGSMLGLTGSTIIQDQFFRMKVGDRHFYKWFNWGEVDQSLIVRYRRIRDIINDRVTMQDIILRNQIENSFPQGSLQRQPFQHFGDEPQELEDTTGIRTGNAAAFMAPPLVAFDTMQPQPQREPEATATAVQEAPKDTQTVQKQQNVIIIALILGCACVGLMSMFLIMRHRKQQADDINQWKNESQSSNQKKLRAIREEQALDRRSQLGKVQSVTDSGFSDQKHRRVPKRRSYSGHSTNMQ